MAWAENLAKDAKKGSLVLVDGRLRQETWTDRESGQKRSRIRVNSHMAMLIPKRPGADAGVVEDHEDFSPALELRSPDGQGQNPEEDIPY